MMTSRHLRSYLLGRLPAAEREAIEERAFEDDVFESEIQEAETDLLDDLARGRLSAADARSVRERFPPAKRKAAFVLALRAEPRARRQIKMPVWFAAAAAVVVCCLPAVYFWRQSRSFALELASARLQHAAQPQTAPPAALEVATLVLRVPSTRGAAVPVFSVAPSARVIRFTADGVPGYPFYEIRIESSAKGLVFSQVTPALSGKLEVDIPAELLGDGNYDVLIFGRARNSSELLATYPVRIQRH